MGPGSASRVWHNRGFHPLAGCLDPGSYVNANVQNALGLVEERVADVVNRAAFPNQPLTRSTGAHSVLLGLDALWPETIRAIHPAYAASHGTAQALGRHFSFV